MAKRRSSPGQAETDDGGDLVQPLQDAARHTRSLPTPGARHRPQLFNIEPDIPRKARPSANVALAIGYKHGQNRDSREVIYF